MRKVDLVVVFVVMELNNGLGVVVGAAAVQAPLRPVVSALVVVVITRDRLLLVRLELGTWNRRVINKQTLRTTLEDGNGAKASFPEYVRVVKRRCAMNRHKSNM